MSIVRNPARQRGLSLIELLISIVVLAILITIAIPSFRWVINTGRITSPANELLATAQLARLEALRRGRPAVLCGIDAPESDSPSCVASGPWRGWMAFIDGDGNGVLGEGEHVLKVFSVPDSTAVIPSDAVNQRLTFSPDGLAIRGDGAPLEAQVRICIESSSPDENIRDVAIRSGSRLGVVRRSGGGACAAPSDVG
jgi:type IV fimbrial biogenesis protein FimT